jgi:hypothetical protein
MLLHIVEIGEYSEKRYKILVTKDIAPEWVKVVISVGLDHVNLDDVIELFQKKFRRVHDSHRNINEYIEQQRDRYYENFNPNSIINDTLAEAEYSYEAKSTIQVIHVFAKYLKTVY